MSELSIAAIRPTACASEFEAAAQKEKPVQRLFEVYRTGVMFIADNGERIALSDIATGLDEGRILWRLARELRPHTIIETGFGQGTSAAFLLSAIYPWRGRLISIDPNFRGWANEIGIAYIKGLGLSEFHTIIEKPSQIVLPGLVAEKRTPYLRLSYIDGLHHFDATLIDFFYLDRMTEIGGIIAIDDAGAPAVRTFLSFVANNLPYCIHIPTYRLALCKKLAMDQREWSHFKPFKSSLRSDWNWHQDYPPDDPELIPGATFGIA